MRFTMGSGNRRSSFVRSTGKSGFEGGRTGMELKQYLWPHGYVKANKGVR